MVLHHVAQGAGPVVVGGPLLHPDRLGDGNLDMVDMLPAPHRLEQRVGEAQGQQVLQIDGQAVAGRHAQHQRTRTLVRAQADLAGNGGAAAAQRHAIGVHHVAAQRVHHAVDVLRPQAVEHQRLIQRDHIGDQPALATGGCLDVLDLPTAEEHGQSEQPQAPATNPCVVPGRLPPTLIHAASPTRPGVTLLAK